MVIQKQIDYWKTGAEEDFAAAQSLLGKGHLRHCLFFAHLAVEKALKAHVVVKTKEIPPRIHDLARLSKITGLNLSKEQKDFLLEFGVYQLEGRYPDSQQMLLDKVSVKKELFRAKEMLEWLKAQLPAL
ncbi:MAG: HEPN domain-containing protein [Sedimentisphaerales bacterium]|nr:HEPN domain-containing protein [Sedimentisphaerales bacterium]